jgi:hypothetical protein
MRVQVGLLCSSLGLVLGCARPEAATPPSHERPAKPARELSEDEDALLASLLSDDPGDFHARRARIWRLGSARWVSDGPELPGRPSSDELARQLEVVVVDAGPRVLLPLDGSVRVWEALRIVAVLSPGDLVAGLTRELRPVPWLTLAAGLPLTPRGLEQSGLRAHWSDPACGFGLDLTIESGDFGPLYEPGPAGPAIDSTGRPEAGTQRLLPGTAIYPDASTRDPVLRLDPEVASHGDRMSAAQQITLIGKPVKGRQEITLRCRGVEVHGFVEHKAIVDNTARYVVVEDAPPQLSRCEGHEHEPIDVARATPLFEPTGDGQGALIGVVAQDTALAASPSGDGWWTACVPSPWGDLVFQFQLR